MPARCLTLHTYTIKNGVHGNPILRCPGNTGCTTPHGVFPFHLEEVFSYTPVYPSLYQMECCDTPMFKDQVFYYTPIRAHDAPNNGVIDTLPMGCCDTPLNLLARVICTVEPHELAQMQAS